MEHPILISYLNDFMFCPASIYFHQLYGSMDRILFQCTDQINGTYAHNSIDNGIYSTKKNVLQGIDIYCDRYNIIGKIDVFDLGTGILTERKKKTKVVYDGYVFQLYGQYYALMEMGYIVSKLRLYSLDDNRTFDVVLPVLSFFYCFVSLTKCHGILQKL